MKLGCTFTPSKMSGRVFSLIWIFYLAGASMAAAFDWPWKRAKQNALEKTDAPRIQIANFSGGTGASATKALRSALMTARELFPISESSPGAFLVTGTSTGGRVVAHLKGSDGKEIFERTYAAPGLDENVKTLSDDLIYAVTGRPGLASSRITFVSDVSGNKQIYVCDLDGGNVEQITREPYGAAAPTVSADASLMAYMSYRSGFSVVQVLDLGGGREQAFSETSGGSTGPAFSPDGRFLSMTLGFVGTPELFVTELGTGRTVCLTETTGVPCSPTWHPKDPVIMYVCDEGAGPRLWLVPMNKDDKAKPWGLSRAFRTDPEWSPDGTQIAYTTRRQGSLCVAIRSYPSGREKIIRKGGAQHPTWSPNGRFLAYVQSGSLVVHDLKTDEHQTILADNGFISEPRWMR